MTVQDDYETPDGDQNAADRRLVVRFSLQPRIDSAKTAEEGREIYKDVEFVTILIPGDKTLTVNRPVMPSDKARFPLQYQAFKNKAGEVITGTPLSAWPIVTESQRRELEHFNVRTVEHLAEINDNFASSMMGIQALKQQAQKYLTAAKAAQPLVQLQQELASRDNDIAALKDQVAKLASMIEEKQAGKK